MNIRKKSYSQFALLDILCTTIGFFLGIYIRHGGFNVINISPVYEEVYFIFILAVITIAFLFRPYEDIFKRGIWIEFINVLKCVIAQMGVAICYMFIMKSGADYSRLSLGYAFVATLAITYISRLLIKRLLREIVNRSFYRSKLLVVTTSDRAAGLVDVLKREPSFTYEISGIVIMDKDMIGEEIEGITVTASAETLYDDARMEVLDSVIIDLEPDYPKFKDTVNLFHVMGVEVNISLFDYNLGIPHQQVVKMGDLTVLAGNNLQKTFGDRIAKRTLDILGGLVGIIFTGILTIFVAPAIYFESPGPIFFSQIRIGKNGRRFKIYKFRSMYMDAEERKKELMEQNKMSGLMFKMDDDPRITKVGKFIRKTSIDEFPQFWNVLKGDMSLVGTRPPTEDEFKQYKARYKKRLSMKPGITGLWQVSGRSTITDFEDVVKLDVQYIENWSFGLDLKILVQTVLVVLKHDGAQ
jgi:exopolysaccharide biosynthesis polyprenyl glycosylphosphotransferase